MMKLKRGWQPNFTDSFSLKLASTLELEGSKVVLRIPCLEDYFAWSSIRAQNQDFLMSYEPKWPEQCLSEDSFVQRLKRQQVERKSGRGEYFLIHDIKDNKIIGGLNLNNIQFGAARHASIGYWLGEEYQGQGYMYEAINLVMDYAFDILKLRRINAACLPDNYRSIKLLESLNFEEEGFAKEYLQINGRWQDHRLFGFLGASR